MHADTERWARAVRSRDPRFDGWIYVAVTTTGIYCRPSCPAVPPKPPHVRFFPTAAAAQKAGFRACKRCRPDASPGSPQWNERADLVARAMRLIADGVIDADGVPGLAARLGYSERQVERQLRAELGVGPLALARAQRAQTARLLIETTALPMAEIAFAAGFSSIRAFNDTIREVFALSPTALRRRTGNGRRPVLTAAAGTPRLSMLSLRLPFRAPMHPDNLFGHLAATAVPGVEEWRDGQYRRTLDLPHGAGLVALRPGPEHIACQLYLADLRDLAPAISRCRRLLDLDADPIACAELLGTDPALAPLIAKAPGRRVPRTPDAGEFALRAVLGQQVSVAAARTLAGRLAVALGRPAADPEGRLSLLFPRPSDLARVVLPAGLAMAGRNDAESPGPEGAVTPGTAGLALAMPAARGAALAGLAAALAGGAVDLGPGCDWERARAGLVALPGIGRWTAELIAMRGLGDPDAFLPGDLGVRRAALALGLPGSPAALTGRAEAWRPWRSYAVQYLWAVLSHPINVMPAERGIR